MPGVLMPDGVEVELPDNPTPDQLNRLRAIKQKFETPPDFTNAANRLEPLPDQVTKPDTSSIIRQGIGETLPAAGMVGGAAFGGPIGSVLGYAGGKALLDLGNAINRHLTGQVSIMDQKPTPKEEALTGLQKTLNDIKEGAFIEASGQIFGKAAAPALNYLSKKAVAFQQLLAKRMPGSAPALHQIASEEAMPIPSKYLLAGAPMEEGMTFETLYQQAKNNEKRLFQKAETLGFKINTDLVIPQIQEILNSEKESIVKTPGMARNIEKIINNLEARPEGVDPLKFQDAISKLSRIRASKQGTFVPGVGYQSPASDFHTWDKLYRTFREALNKAAEMPLGEKGTEGIMIPNTSARVLKQAIDQSRRLHVAKDLEEAITKGIDKYPMGYREGIIKFNARTILKNIEKDALLNKTIEKDELRRIKDALIKMKNIPTLSPAAGARSGSYTFWMTSALGSALGGIAGAGYGAIQGNIWEGAKKGTTLGGGIAVLGAAGMSGLLMTKKGTDYLMKTLSKTGGEITPELVTQWSRWLASEGALINSLNSKQGVVYQNGKESR